MDLAKYSYIGKNNHTFSQTINYTSYNILFLKTRGFLTLLSYVSTTSATLFGHRNLGINSVQT